MLRALRTPVLRTSARRTPVSLIRSLAVASSESYSKPSPISGSHSTIAEFLQNEPKKPNLVTDFPGPKLLAAKEAMSKLQDVSS